MGATREQVDHERAREASLPAHSMVVAPQSDPRTDDTLAADSAPPSSGPVPASDPRGVLPGAMLTDSIRLSYPIGSGGMGTIWRAEHLGLRVPVAVKFLKASFADHPGAVARFHREAAAAARIRSPHVVQVLDHGISATGAPFIVMELLEGETLDARLSREGLLSVAETAEIVRQVGHVLARAHDLGVIHRDIKPENLFIVEGERQPFVKVLDFGVAKLEDDEGGHAHVTMAGSVVGTPQYMSPEQMTGHAKVGPATDLWSLGVVAYACFTGLLPFEGGSLAEIAVSIDRGAMVPASALSPNVTAAIDAWLARALEPSPARRFATVAEMLDALESALVKGHTVLRSAPAPSSLFPLVTRTQSSGPPRARPSATPRPSERFSWDRRRRALAMLSLGFGAAVVAVAAFVSKDSPAKESGVHVPAAIVASARATSVLVVPAVAPPLPVEEPVTASDEHQEDSPRPTASAVASPPPSYGHAPRSIIVSEPQKSSSTFGAHRRDLGF